MGVGDCLALAVSKIGAIVLERWIVGSIVEVDAGLVYGQ
jgi:hypothetical protein